MSLLKAIGAAIIPKLRKMETSPPTETEEEMKRRWMSVNNCFASYIKGVCQDIEAKNGCLVRRKRQLRGLRQQKKDTEDRVRKVYRYLSMIDTNKLSGEEREAMMRALNHLRGVNPYIELH